MRKARRIEGGYVSKKAIVKRIISDAHNILYVEMNRVRNPFFVRDDRKQQARHLHGDFLLVWCGSVCVCVIRIRPLAVPTMPDCSFRP